MEDLERAIHFRESGQLEEARTILLDLINQDSMNPSVWYQCAWVHDVMELEREAIPYYKRSLELELQDEERQGAYLGLGSTFRTLGMYDEAQLIFEEAIRTYPDRREYQVFYAMVRFNQAAYSEAMEIILKQLADTSNDKGIQEYKKAILFYSDKLSRIWD
ncbi:tetratricopeptide repeat protein [Paenibacillus lycopersici]|uniref:Tetratricopeptide repeat protein n=1 Tax=Paenibacillus lycopersici TaxID=2704462 RepID=A0A6C0G3Q4_9BACL|nr:tetratricopeptide repeat protein [Paenibacillus lycopersici]QHT61320.1 tetratricopeptide repeat protein [Paenibacillus lycopersici]